MSRRTRLWLVFIFLAVIGASVGVVWMVRKSASSGSEAKAEASEIGKLPATPTSGPRQCGEEAWYRDCAKPTKPEVDACSKAPGGIICCPEGVFAEKNGTMDEDDAKQRAVPYSGKNALNVCSCEYHSGMTTCPAPKPASG